MSVSICEFCDSGLHATLPISADPPGSPRLAQRDVPDHPGRVHIYTCVKCFHSAIETFRTESYVNIRSLSNYGTVRAWRG